MSVEEDSEGDPPEGSEEEELDLQGKIEELKKELQYAKAETVNVGHRAARDRTEALKYGGASLARRLIPVVDILGRAVESAESGESSDSVIEGVKLTLDGLKSSLESEGITQIEALGKRFDPTCMEAIATIPCPEGKDPGSVIEVVESGYRMHERILRASRVIVSEGDT
ncbi:MAG: nucleotide exchange factor GrpE [Euryarchaeota archaeon]|nr:nucleotide exchange factor GrpE [Euryarchaeota archaeon]